MISQDLVGKRIRLTSMPDDPDPIEVGAEGTVYSVSGAIQGRQSVDVDWDNGRGLSLVCPPDEFEIIEDKPSLPQLKGNLLTTEEIKAREKAFLMQMPKEMREALGLDF